MTPDVGMFLDGIGVATAAWGMVCVFLAWRVAELRADGAAYRGRTLKGWIRDSAWSGLSVDVTVTLKDGTTFDETRELIGRSVRLELLERGKA